MDEKDIVNTFFSNNYSLLIKKCQDYVTVYNYNKLAPDELVSELLLYSLQDAHRTSKLAQLIQLSAATLNKLYNYNTKALYYISKILYNIVHGHRSFSNNSNKDSKNIIFDYNANVETIGIDIEDIEYVETEEYDVEKIALKYAHDENNWWKFRLWSDYYLGKMTYRQLSIKYKLTISPIFSAVKNFNEIIKSDIQNSSCHIKK